MHCVIHLTDSELLALPGQPELIRHRELLESCDH